MNQLFVLLLLPFAVQAFYSINFAADKDASGVKGGKSTFISPPMPEHVADIYARMSGYNPLLHEDKIELPSMDSLRPHKSKPILLEVHGGRLPNHVQKVIGSTAFNEGERGPSLESVLDHLKSRGIDAESHKIDATNDRSTEISKWLSAQDRPVIILHHETPATYHFLHRSLSTSTTNVTALTEFQISQYQICLWTGVIMVLLISSAICSIINMEVIPDSLLFAKFQSARTQKND